MKPADTQAAKSDPTKAGVHGDAPKRRTVTELPTSIDDGAGHVILAGLSLPELADWQKSWKQKMADIPRIELELRSINAEIRKRGR